MLPTGSCPTVGVGGQVLAGGFGGSSRSAGLFLDNLVEMEVVLANGERVIISPEKMDDLYWVSLTYPSFGLFHIFIDISMREKRCSRQGHERSWIFISHSPYIPTQNSPRPALRHLL